MKKLSLLKLTIKFGFFALILTLGTLIAMISEETEGVARVDLANVPIQTLTTVSQGEELIAYTAADSQLAGIYHSPDNGQTWRQVSSGPQMPLTVLSGHANNPAVFYAGGSGGPLESTQNLWRSLDGGRSWHDFNLKLPASPDHLLPAITAMAVDPEQPELLYVGTDGQGVYRFREGQLGYELVGGISLHNAHVKVLTLGSNSQLYALTNEGLFMTVKDTWQSVETPDHIISLAIPTYTPQTVYAGSVSTGVYRSIDGGKKWESINQGLEMPPGAALRVTALAVDRQNPNHLVLATAYGLGSQFAPGHLYESHNGGNRWTRVAVLDSLVSSLVVNRGGIHATTAQGLVHYGQPAAEIETPVDQWSLTGRLHSLIRPSGNQVLILLLTVGLAGLTIINPLSWWLGWRKRAVR